MCESTAMFDRIEEKVEVCEQWRARAREGENFCLNRRGLFVRGTNFRHAERERGLVTMKSAPLTLANFANFTFAVHAERRVSHAGERMLADRFDTEERRADFV